MTTRGTSRALMLPHVSFVDQRALHVYHFDVEEENLAGERMIEQIAKFYTLIFKKSKIVSVSPMSVAGHIEFTSPWVGYFCF